MLTLLIPRTLSISRNAPSVTRVNCEFTKLGLSIPLPSTVAKNCKYITYNIVRIKNVEMDVIDVFKMITGEYAEKEVEGEVDSVKRERE